LFNALFVDALRVVCVPEHGWAGVAQPDGAEAELAADVAPSIDSEADSVSEADVVYLPVAGAFQLVYK
jgi:hypothetical protein